MTLAGILLKIHRPSIGAIALDRRSTPFGGTPSNNFCVVGRSQKVLSRLQIDFSADSKENDADGNSPPSLERKVVAMPRESTESGLSGAMNAGALLDEVYVLKARGDLTDAMSILLELVENPILDREQKIRMHQALAETGHKLGWLY